MDPKERLTINEALNHTYFDEIRAEYDQYSNLNTTENI